MSARYVRLVSLMSAATIAAFAGTLSPQLASMPPGETVQVIVVHTPTLVGSLLSTVCGMLNLIKLLPLGELCTMTVSAAISLAQNPAVAHVSVNNTLQGLGYALPVYDYMPETVQPLSTGSASANMKAGAGIGVAVIDSGIHVNQDLTGNGTNGLSLQNLFPNVAYAESFVSAEGVDDYYGHGTHVAGIIAGNGANSYGAGFLHDIHGVAPGAHLINLKVLDRNGQSSDAAVIQAIDRAIQLRLLYNIKVINLSLGRPVFESYKTDPLCQEVEKAWQAGITVVVAAGNGGRDNSGEYQWLRHHRGSRQRSAGDHRRRDEHRKHSAAQRRPDDHLQFERADADRPCGEARPGRARQQNILDSRSRRHARNHGGGECCSARFLREVAGVRPDFELLHPERHQYGCGRGERSRGGAARQPAILRPIR